MDRHRGAERDSTTVREAVSTAATRVDADGAASDALIVLDQARVDYALVEAAGDAVGLLAMAEFTEALWFASSGGKPAAPLEKGVGRSGDGSLRSPRPT